MCRRESTQQRRNSPVLMNAYLSCSADLCSQSVFGAHYEYIYERITACFILLAKDVIIFRLSSIYDAYSQLVPPPFTPRWRRAVPLALVRASPTFLCLNPEEECPPCVRLCHDVPAVRINLVHPLPPPPPPSPPPLPPPFPLNSLRRPSHLFLSFSSSSSSLFHLFSHPLTPRRNFLLSLHLQHSIPISLPTYPSFPPSPFFLLVLLSLPLPFEQCTCTSMLFFPLHMCSLFLCSLTFLC